MKIKKNCFSCNNYYYDEGLPEYPDEACHICLNNKQMEKIIFNESDLSKPDYNWENWHRCYIPKEKP